MLAHFAVGKRPITFLYVGYENLGFDADASQVLRMLYTCVRDGLALMCVGNVVEARVGNALPFLKPPP